MTPPRPLTIALVGFGNIGSGVVRHLREHGQRMNALSARPLRLKTICDRDITTDRGVSTDGIQMTDDWRAVVADAEVDVVIELVGGTTIARQVVEGALRAGKHVVTANKALIATYGAELFAAADAGNAQLLFEASVGAGIPLIRALQQGLTPNSVTGLYGILNGTCNFILSAMEDKPGLTYQEILKEAMARGYAEPDPTLDVRGNDTAHKIAVLASLAFGEDFRGDDVETIGITEIAPADFRYADTHGLALKLLASARRQQDGAVSLSVCPTFIPKGHMMGGVRGVLNALWVEAAPIGPTMYYGAGAGQGSTSSGVLSDVLLLAQVSDAATLRNLNPLRPKGKRGTTGNATANYPKHYLRLPATTAPDARAVLGLDPIATYEGGVSIMVPEHSPTERGEWLTRLGKLGLSPEAVCEIRFALATETGKT